MALKPKSAWSLGTAGLCVVLSAASWFLLIEPERAEAAASREQTVAAEQTNAQLEVRIEQLRREFAALPARQAELAAVRQALPEQPALAALLREIDAAAADSGVTLDALTSGAAAVVLDPAAPVTGAAGVQPDAAAADGSTPEDTTEPVVGAETGAEPAPGSAPGAVADGSEVPGAPAGAVLAAVPLTIDTTAGFHESTLFVKALQADISRALLVDSLTATVVEGEQAEDPGTVRTTLSARVFVYVDPDGVDGLDPVTVPTE